MPFLASASSDLDEGFDGDGESVVAGPDILRPSPRKELYRDHASKSMVGHTPTPSIGYDLSTLTAPLRTSTPVHGRSRHSPPLPPYSVSDVSTSPLPVARYGSSEPSIPRAQPMQLSETTDDDQDMLEKMQRRADEFYETGLRGRCWDVWAQASGWVQVGSADSDGNSRSS